jgi:hypothetical protein
VKTCSKCNQEYPSTLEFFHKNRDGLRADCKLCNAKRVKKYYHNIDPKEKKRRYDKNRRSNEEYKKRERSRQLAKIGFTLELFNQMLEDQGNLCALCGTDNPGGNRTTFNADHDHKTGNPRGLLCMSCNLAIGYIELKDLSWLNKAIKYIEDGGFH